MPLLLHEPVAHWLVVAVVATYRGRARDGERRAVGNLADSLLIYARRPGTAGVTELPHGGR